MHIYYKELNLRLVHYTVSNQDKGSTALVRATFFNVWGSQICLIKKKCQKVKPIVGFDLHFLIFSLSLVRSSIFESSFIVNSCDIKVVSL